MPVPLFDAHPAASGRRSGAVRWWFAVLLLAGVGGAAAQAVAPAPSGADASVRSIAWRQASVDRGHDVRMALSRRGVAIFSDGEPATLSSTSRALGWTPDRRMSFEMEERFRFDDGSGFVVRTRGSTAVGPNGLAAPGETVREGEVAEGTGRFAGLAGTVRVRARNDMSPQADGMLGDAFAEGSCTCRLPR